MNLELYESLKNYIVSFTREPFHVIYQDASNGLIRIDHTLSGTVSQGYYNFPLNVDNKVMYIVDVMHNAKVIKHVDEIVYSDHRPFISVMMDYSDRRLRRLHIKLRDYKGSIVYEDYIYTYSMNMTNRFKQMCTNKEKMRRYAKRLSSKLKNLTKEEVI